MSEAAQDVSTSEPVEQVNICVIFDYKQEQWNHKFSIAKGSTITELKQFMLVPGSPPEDRISFDLCKQRLRLSNMDTIDTDETLHFKYLGPEEGSRLFEKDKVAREREEEAARLSREREQERQLAEKNWREEAAKQKAEVAEVKKVTPVVTPVKQQPTPPAQPRPTAPPEPRVNWLWTAQGVAAVQSKAAIYGHPHVNSPFTDAHLATVKSDNPTMWQMDFVMLADQGYICLAPPVAPPIAAPKEPQRVVVEPESTCITVTYRENTADTIKVLLPPGQTVLDLKKAICSQIMRGPSSKLTLTHRTGKLLGDSSKLDALTVEERGGIVAFGLELGPPALVSVTIFHAAKDASGESVAVEVVDTSTFLDVKKELCDRLGGKTSEVRLVTKKPGTAGFLGCKDSDRLNGLREVGAVGKLMERLSGGSNHVAAERPKVGASGAKQQRTPPPSSSNVEVEIAHAKHGSTLMVQVPADATILQLRQAIMKALGQPRMSEVLIVSSRRGNGLTPEPDSDVIGGRREFQMLGCDLPNPP